MDSSKDLDFDEPIKKLMSYNKDLLDVEIKRLDKTYKIDIYIKSQRSENIDHFTDVYLDIFENLYNFIRRNCDIFKSSFRYSESGERIIDWPQVNINISYKIHRLIRIESYDNEEYEFLWKVRGLILGSKLSYSQSISSEKWINKLTDIFNIEIKQIFI